jgi:hypothetical protein
VVAVVTILVIFLVAVDAGTIITITIKDIPAAEQVTVILQ